MENPPFCGWEQRRLKEAASFPEEGLRHPESPEGPCCPKAPADTAETLNRGPLLLPENGHLAKTKGSPSSLLRASGNRESEPKGRGEHLQPMQLRLSDPALIPELRQHFERSGFVTNRVSEDIIAAWRPDARSAEQERRAIELHLAVWRAMHAGIATELID